MVIMDQDDETDTSRVEMEVTPLQKTTATRKTKKAQRGRKRKSVEMLADDVSLYILKIIFSYNYKYAHLWGRFPAANC